MVLGFKVFGLAWLQECTHRPDSVQSNDNLPKGLNMNDDQPNLGVRSGKCDEHDSEKHVPKDGYQVHSLIRGRDAPTLDVAGSRT